MSRPLVSVLLPTYNDRGTLPAVLDGIASQTTGFAFETVAVDSGSTDGTLDLLDRRVDRLVRVPPGSFNHGLTRNLGIQNSRGELVVLIVQDAVPVSDRWLVALVDPMLADPCLAGTWARQVARPGASPVARHYVERWSGSSEAGRVSAIASEDALRALPAAEQVRLCSFDNVCSCLRRAVWEQYPFPATPIAEDVEWARAVLLAGYRLAYVPGAAVFHSHERSPRYELWRTYLVHQRLSRLFGLRTIPTARHLLAAIGVSLAAHLRCTIPARPRLREVVRSMGLAVAFPLGQYLGARSAETGRSYLRPRGV